MRTSLSLLPLTLADEALVDALLDRLPRYLLNVDGVAKTTDGARQLLTAYPPGMPSSRKHVFAIVEDSAPVGLVDLLDGYPTPGIAFLGLLAIAEDRGGEGRGREAYVLVEHFVQRILRSEKIRLAVVASNPVLGFWERMGFAKTGEIRPYRGAHLVSTSTLMEKLVRGAP